MNKLYAIIVGLALFLSPVRAAITPATVWEVRGSVGSSTNGGGFDSTISGAGTDMSVYDNKNASGCSSCQSATVNISTTDAVTNNTTTVTSATANFSSALIGNTIYLSGTGTTTGWYQVTAVGSSTSITVDRATGSTGGTGVTMNIGGALAQLQNVSAAAPGNKVWFKSYTMTSSQLPPAGTTGNTIVYEGYSSSRGDGGPAVVTFGASSQSFSLQSYSVLKNATLNCNSQASTTGLNMSGTAQAVKNVSITGDCATRPVTVAASNGTMSNIRITGHSTAASAVNLTGGGWRMIDVTISGNSIPAVSIGTSGYSVWVNPIIANNGTGNDCMTLNGTTSMSVTVLHGVFYGCQNGIYGAGSDALNGLIVRNTIFSGNAGYGISAGTGTSWAASPEVSSNYNAYYNNTSGALYNFPAGPNDITLTATPFTDAAGGNFALNTTSGGGAALRAAGFPGARLSGGTGYIDIGPLQHQDTGAASCPQVAYGSAQ